jgi:hypothetical protein
MRKFADPEIGCATENWSSRLDIGPIRIPMNICEPTAYGRADLTTAH